jgi:para-nitrobenzyl esterase
MDERFEMHKSSSGPVVAVTGAGRVEGLRDNGANVFKGIPYGASTGGEARWLPPRPPAAWDDIRRVHDFGPMCPQVFGAPLEEETAILQRGPTSEDCLNLNVWTPALEDHALPVMVWFHGGVFSVGSGASTSNDGANLAVRNDVVVVTINHRLNLFGFLDVSGVGGDAYATSRNVGLLDCVAALEWVRDNIAAFGGDPNNVTIFGHSGGGIKVMHLMSMPAARGLIHRAIAMSGFAIKTGSAAQSAALAQGVMEGLDLGDEPFTALQALPAEKLVDVMREQPHLMFTLGPSVDNTILPTHPFAPEAPALSADVPLMLGTTETEIVFLPFAPLDPIDEATLHASLREYTGLADGDLTTLIEAYRREYPDHDNTYLYQVLASDWLVGADGVLAAERKAAHGAAPVWLYYWTRHTNARGGKLRAPHTVEVPYAFDTLDKKPPIVGETGPADQEVADRMSRTWAAFARTGDPNNAAIPNWPAYDLESRPVLVIGDTFSVARDPHPATREAMRAARATLAG